MIISLDGIVLEKSQRLGFSATHNEAKYEALLAGFTAMQNLGGKVIRAYCHSRLIVGQVWGDFEAKDLRILWYLNQVKRFSGGFHSFTLEQVPQITNSHANLLATLAIASQENLPRIILVENYALPAYDILILVGVHFTQVGPNWMELFSFLKNGILPKDKIEAEKIRTKTPWFWLFED